MKISENPGPLPGGKFFFSFFFFFPSVRFFPPSPKVSIRPAFRFFPEVVYDWVTGGRGDVQ